MSLSKPALNAVRMAYMAKDAIERIHDQTSLGTAGTAVATYLVMLTDISREDQRQAKAAYPDVPTLGSLLQDLQQAGKAVWATNFSGELAAVS